MFKANYRNSNTQENWVRKERYEEPLFHSKPVERNEKMQGKAFAN